MSLSSLIFIEFKLEFAKNSNLSLDIDTLLSLGLHRPLNLIRRQCQYDNCDYGHHSHKALAYLFYIVNSLKSAMPDTVNRLPAYSNPSMAGRLLPYYFSR